MPEEALAAECVALAQRLADAAAEITLPYFRSDLPVDVKDDDTPVTKADRETEAALRALIEAAFPDHGIIGEEYGQDRANADYVWVLDPIDGTVSFINGVPLFTTIVGVIKEGKPWFGLIDQPVLKDRWYGGAGLPTTLNGIAARTRRCPSLDQATVYATAPDMFADQEQSALNQLSNAVKLLRYGGTDCYHYGMVATGWTDMVCEKLSVYEYGAVVPIIEHAGGNMTDWRGNPLQGTEYRQVLASGDRAIHRAATDILSQELS